MERPMLEMTVHAADGLLRIVLDGALVERTTPRLRTWMHVHVPVTTRRLVLDLRGLQDVDAVGLGALLAARRRVAPGGTVVLEAPAPAVARALRQAGMDSVLVQEQRAA